MLHYNYSRLFTELGSTLVPYSRHISVPAQQVLLLLSLKPAALSAGVSSSSPPSQSCILRHPRVLASSKTQDSHVSITYQPGSRKENDALTTSTASCGFLCAEWRLKNKINSTTTSQCHHSQILTKVQLWVNNTVRTLSAYQQQDTIFKGQNNLETLIFLQNWNSKSNIFSLSLLNTDSEYIQTDIGS